MSLRRKLTLFFVLIVMLPLSAAAIVVQQVVVGEARDRAKLSLQPSLNSALAAYNGRAPYIDGLVKTALGSRRSLGRALAGGDDRLGTYLARHVGGQTGVDFLLIEDAAGAGAGEARRIVAFESTKARFTRGFESPDPLEIGASAHRDGRGSGPGFLTSRPVRVEVRDRKDSYFVIGGIWVDAELLGPTPQEDVELSIVSGRTVIASTSNDPAPPPAGLPSSTVRPSRVDVLNAEQGLAQRLPFGRVSIVASTPSDPISDLARDVLLSELALLVLALLITGALAYSLARLITRPLDELSEGAKAIAEGRFDHQIPVRSRDEVGDLALAFNDMTEQLRDTITELSSSRDQLQRAVRRVGETLRSTHDMRQILESLLNTAADAVEAPFGVLWTFTSTRDELYPVLASGLDAESLSRVAVGSGIVGLVAERGTPIVRSPDRRTPRVASTEPNYPAIIAVPLYSEDRVTGVIALYRMEDREFTREDYETVLFLAEQGGVAIENVLLHDEAQRLSITDGLTGVWNRRYFQMQFRQVLATSTRFKRAFSVLMLDLDHFKVVNDTHGHQRGDAILIEFAHRVSSVLREVDTVARYGGEEFICLLSETDTFGALTTAEKIRDVIRSQPFYSMGEEPLRVTASIGLASYPEHGSAYPALVEAADRALYRAKEDGRDRIKIAEKPSPNLKLAT
ncbi:MAG: diguanylate cyclase [Actinomycetota bacterium]|nr:diguanylate cyclase [Actinomycetota bacterium]